MDNNVEESPALLFFRKVIREYNCGDVKWLLKNKTPALGPLLATVATGIDTVGGLVRGFGSGSKDRSMTFMKEYMAFDASIAEIVYRCARCGYLHEGIGKLNFSWFADYERVKPGYVLFRRQDGGVALNVVEFAHKYLDAVDKVWENSRAKLLHLPVAKPDDQSALVEAARTMPSLDEVLTPYHGRVDEVRGSHSLEDVLKEMKYWQFDGYPSL